jgi:hypothetical protein
MNYQEAESKMREGEKVARKAWPVGRVAFHDVEGDGIPDHVKATPVGYYPEIQRDYELFVRNIRISEDGKIIPGSFITHADSLANDWFLVQ